jgi:hypothetical protein
VNFQVVSVVGLFLSGAPEVLAGRTTKRGTAIIVSGVAATAPPAPPMAAAARSTRPGSVKRVEDIGLSL